MNKNITLTAAVSLAMCIVLMLVVLLFNRNANPADNNSQQDNADVTGSSLVTSGGNESEDDLIPDGYVSSVSTESSSYVKKAPEEVYDSEPDENRITEYENVIPLPDENDSEQYNNGIIPLDPHSDDGKDEFELPEV